MRAHVFSDQWRDRYFQLVLLFGGGLIYGSLLLGQLAVEQEGRVLFNSGALLIELAALGALLYGCASTILRDMEAKTIYLLLSRPVPRWVYIAGTYSGLGAAAGRGCAVHGRPAFYSADGQRSGAPRYRPIFWYCWRPG